MQQIKQIMKVIKQQLKAAGKTYQEVAQHLDLSEASVKRLFSQQDLSLQRLQSIADLLGMELLDIMYLARQQRHKISHLRLEQEQEIIDDEKLMLVLICIFSHWTFTQILDYYKFEKSELLSILLRLDKIGIIELLPNNRIKLLISAQFDWQPNGPIQRFFQEHMQSEFLRAPFKENNELLICRNGMLTAEKNNLLRQEMRKLADKFLQYSAEDANQPLEQREGCAFFIALRPWVPSLFDKYKINHDM